jgi:formate hydrogenlyase subunit 3/multisubunit Na+/H+ antiporter MnhD subunit
MRQRRLSMLVAYSSVSQIGFLFVTFGLRAPAAFSGTVFLILSHALAKAAMFLAAGSILRCLQGDDVTQLHGLARKLPLTFAALGIAGTSLMGLPPSAGFIAKWLLLRASMEAQQWDLAAIILLSGLLTAGYLARVFYGAFLPLPPGRTLCSVPRFGQVIALFLASLAAVLGIFPQLARPLATLGTP